MKLYRIERSQFLPVSIKTAWNFFSNPYNLQQITPAWLDFKITNPIPEEMYVGMVIQFHLKTLFRMPTTWITEITHVEPSIFFVDEMRLGPYRFWHHQHRFIEKINGVEAQDKVHYALKFGFLGQIMHDMVIGAKLVEIFDFRKSALEKIFGGGRSPR